MKRIENLSKWSGLRLTSVMMSLILAVSWSAYRVSERYLNAGEPAVGKGVSYRLFSMGEGLVTEGNFFGSWVLLWFFDTHCPKATCGPIIKMMSQTKDLLFEQSMRVAPLAVTLSPRQDEADDLKKYVMPLSHEVIPLTGSPLMIQRLTQYFKIPVYTEQRADGVAYHHPPGSIMIINPRGQWVDTVPVTIGSEALARRLNQLARHK